MSIDPRDVDDVASAARRGSLDGAWYTPIVLDLCKHFHDTNVASLQGTQDALQGLREAHREGFLVGWDWGRAPFVKVCAAERSPFDAWPEAFQGSDAEKATLSSSTLQAGGWNYDMEAAPLGEKLDLTIKLSGKPYAIQSELYRWGSELLAANDRGNVDAPYAWRRSFDAAPLPVSDKGGEEA